MRVMRAACPEMKRRSDEFMRRFCFALKRFPPDIKGRGIVNLLRLAVRVAGGNHVQSAARDCPSSIRCTKINASSVNHVHEKTELFVVYVCSGMGTGAAGAETQWKYVQQSSRGPEQHAGKEKCGESRGEKFPLLFELVSQLSHSHLRQNPQRAEPDSPSHPAASARSAPLRAPFPLPLRGESRVPNDAGLKRKCGLSSVFSFFQVEAAPLRSPSSEAAPSSGMAPTTDAQEKYTYRHDADKREYLLLDLNAGPRTTYSRDNLADPRSYSD
ncbi:hypothetical protein SRHO_G00215200 [Serrasalmus rhombeus]